MRVHVQESAGGEYLRIQLLSSARTDREAIGTFLGLARAERAARKRSRARARDFFLRFQLFCDFLDVGTFASISGTKFVCLMCTLTIVSFGVKPALDMHIRHDNTRLKLASNKT